MDRAVKQLSKSMEDAEKEREAVRLNCLSETVFGAYAERGGQRSQGRDGCGDCRKPDGSCEHEFRKIAVALQKTREFAAEGEACVGDAGTSPGITSVDVSQEIWMMQMIPSPR